MKPFQIYYPIKPYTVTQKFGETANLQYYKDNGIIFNGHNGIDMTAKHGQPIYAAHDGIAYYEVDEDQGHGVILRNEELSDYLGSQVYMKTIYWHMVDSSKEPQYESPVEKYRDLTKQGMPVKAGDLLGYANSTGLSTGDHLHFGLKPTLPSEPDWQIGSNLVPDNGYQGAIDPTPYFNGLYAEDLNNSPQSTTSPFYVDMSYGFTSNEIVRLQSVLKTFGYFPKQQECTGYFLEITRNSVYQFQLDHVNLTPWEYFVLRGKKVGPKTRQALNELIIKK